MCSVICRAILVLIIVHYKSDVNNVVKLNFIIQIHLEYTAAALFEEFYAIEGVNKAASPDSFYRAIEDIVFTPFDYDAERDNIPEASWFKITVACGRPIADGQPRTS